MIIGVRLMPNKFRSLFLPCFAFGGGILNRGTLTITNSTLRGNTVGGRPSGLGGIANFGRVTITNRTLSRNNADAFGIGGGGGIYNAGTLTINNGTVSGNSAQKGGGMYNTYANFGFSCGSVNLQNSIVANNFLSGNCSGISLTSHGYNLSSDGTCKLNNP